MLVYTAAAQYSALVLQNAHFVEVHAVYTYIAVCMQSVLSDVVFCMNTVAGYMSSGLPGSHFDSNTVTCTMFLINNFMRAINTRAVRTYVYPIRERKWL